METTLPYLLGGLAGLLLGGGIAYAILQSVLKGKASTIIKEAEQKGENIKEKKILQAKEKFLKLKEDGIEREIPLANGWTASFKKRKRTDGGDACITKLGEPSLRSLPDIRRRFGSSSME